MASLEKKNLTAPDERRALPNTTMETVRFGDRTVTRITYQPGWRWTTDIKPTSDADLCPVNHFVYVLSGRTHVVMADGREMDIEPGDIVTIPADHDAWVIGDEACVLFDFGGAARPE